MWTRTCLFGLFLSVAVDVTIGASVAECISKTNQCGGDAMTTLSNAINGFTLESYGASMLEAFCRDKDHLMDCLESSRDTCPDSLVDMWNTKLLALAFNCAALECSKKLIACGTDVATQFSIGMSRNPETYLIMGTGLTQDLCRSSDKLKVCIKNAEAQCTSAVTNIWSAQLDAIKPVCEMLPCNNALNACFYPNNYIMINPTFDVRTLLGSCSIIDDTDKCLQRITACPREVTVMVSSTMSTYHRLCKTTADCTKSVLNCVGPAANPFFGAVASGTFEVATLEKVCPVQDSLSTCLEQSTTCPPSFKEQYKATVQNFITPGCIYMPCAKKFEQCVGEVGKMLVGGTDYGAGALEQVCQQRVAILKCLDSLTPECPTEYIQMQNSILQTYLGMGCKFIPCIKKVQECHVNMLTEVNIQQLNPASLIIFCNNVVIAKSCIATLNPECPATVINPYMEAMNVWAESCSTVACTNELVGCFGEHGNNLMNPKFDAITMTNACSDINNINTCVQQITTCPAEFLKPYLNAVNAYQDMCNQIGSCTKSLEDCAGEPAGVFMNAASTGSFGTATLETICGAEKLLTSCINQLRTCPLDYVNMYVDGMAMAKAGCSFTDCLKKLESCGNEYTRTFMSGTDFAVGGLEQICKHNATIRRCLDQMNDVCPSSIAEAKQLELAVTLQSCSFVPCAKKVQACGVHMFKDIDITSFDQDSIVSFCKNVIRVETCMKTVGSECPKEATEQWENPLKDWGGRCTDILNRARQKSRSSSGGKEVVIVLKLDMEWQADLENLESEKTKPFVAELKNSLTEVYKDTKGFKEVTIVRLFKSSVGVEHTVEYEQELTAKDLASVAASLNAALAKNGNALSIGNKTFAAVGKPEMIFADKPIVTDLCDVYTKDSECLNGGACYASTTEARCVCKYGFRGDYCGTKSSGQRTTLPTMAAIVVSIMAILLATGRFTHM